MELPLLELPVTLRIRKLFVKEEITFVTTRKNLIKNYEFYKTPYKKKYGKKPTRSRLPSLKTKMLNVINMDVSSIMLISVKFKKRLIN